MSKKILMWVGVIVLLMGVVALVPAWEWAAEPTWETIVNIIIGIVAIYVSATDK